MMRLKAGPIFTLLLLAGANADQIPFSAPGGVAQRLQTATLVVAATLVTTSPTGESPLIQGHPFAANTAQAQVDTVFVGSWSGEPLWFTWYSTYVAPDSHGYLYAGPPPAQFVAGKRYLIFLRGTPPSHLEVTVPFYQLEIPLASEAVSQSLVSPSDAAVRNRLLATEFVAAIRALPHERAFDAFGYFTDIRELLGKDAKPIYKDFLSSTENAIRYSAAVQLAELKDKSAVPQLLETLQDRSADSYMRVNAARDLGMLKSLSARLPLESMATDSNPEVRHGALAGLSFLADPASVPVLIRALDDDAIGQQPFPNSFMAAGALGNIFRQPVCSVDSFNQRREEIITAWKTWYARGGSPPHVSCDSPD